MRSERAAFREKLSFGSGAVIYCVEMILVLTYLMLFCSDVLQIDVAIIGIVMSAVKILDAVSDLIITSLADRTNTRFGKYRIWILNGFWLAGAVVLMFWSPSFLKTDTAKIIWVCVLYVIMVPILETSVTCPYMAMIVTMSEDPKDRLDFSNARALGEAAAQIIVSLLVMPIILLFGSYKDITGWRIMALVIAAIIVICTITCFAGTKERITVSYTNDAGSRMSLKEKLTPLKKNVPFWKTMLVILFFMAHFYASSTLFTYFCIYNLGREDWASPLLTIGFIFQIAVTLLLFWLGRKFEKKLLLIAGGLCIIAADIFLLFANSFASAACYQILLGIGNGIFNSIAFAMLPDITDYTEWKTGIALPGMISAVATFAMKLGGAASTFLASRILILARYDETLTVQSSYTCSVLRYSIPIVSCVCLAAAIILTLGIKEVSRDKVVRYREEINKKKEPESDLQTA